MGWVPPANRRNQHTKGWQIQVYDLPASDKTGQLTALTHRVNRVLAIATSKYTTGQRVTYSATGRYSGMTSAVISCVNHDGFGVQYTMDNGQVIFESMITGVVSLTILAAHKPALQEVA